MSKAKKILFDTTKDQIQLIVRTLRLEDKISQNTFDDISSRLKMLDEFYPSTGDLIDDIKRMTSSSSVKITVGTPVSAAEYIQYKLLFGPDTVVITEKI